MMRSLLFLAVLATSATAQPARVLFLGNSITLHGPKADIGWTGNWGMAASAADRDYVHLVTRALTEKSGEAPDVWVRNIADFERAHQGYDAGTRLREAVDFKADLIILAIGENVPALKTIEAQERFQADVTGLLRTLQGDRQPTILVRSCFWANPAKDTALREAGRAVGAIFVDIRDLGSQEENYARSERDHEHAGVARHPGDRGMAAIARALIAALPAAAP